MCIHGNLNVLLEHTRDKLIQNRNKESDGEYEAQGTQEEQKQQ